MWKMQLLQLLRGLRIAVSKTIPQPYLLKITRNHFQGNPFQTVFFHSLSSNNKGFFAHSAISLFAYKNEALLGVIGIRDIWVNNYRDTGYLGGKLKGYGIFLKRFWDIED